MLSFKKKLFFNQALFYGDLNFPLTILSERVLFFYCTFILNVLGDSELKF